MRPWPDFVLLLMVGLRPPTAANDVGPSEESLPERSTPASRSVVH